MCVYRRRESFAASEQIAYTRCHIEKTEDGDVVVCNVMLADPNALNEIVLTDGAEPAVSPNCHE